jgi:hypothetical protein
MFFPGTSAIGQSIRIADPVARGDQRRPGEWMTIVGVAQNVRQRPGQNLEFDPVVYVPYATPESTGLSTTPGTAPWLMYPGTPGAHIMISPPKK